MICARTRDNRTYLKRVKAVIDQYQPKLIVLEYFKTHKDRHKTKRIRELIRSIAKYAQEQGIEIQYYSRAQVREVFSFYNAQKKYEIAELICTWIPELLLLMYPPREGERTEPHGSAVFSAVSLVLTHYYLNE